MTATLVWIGAGGALGAVSRYLVVAGAERWTGPMVTLPWGTLIVNLLGSFAAGALVAWLSGSASSPSMARPFLLVGFLGGFTTFSAFSVESLGLVQAGRPLVAMTYAVVSVVGCVGGAWVGMKCST